MNFPTRGLYAITQTEQKTDQHILAEVDLALQAGVVVVQYRDKNPMNALSLGSKLLTLCHTYDVPLIINDDIDLATIMSADGVHLGREDGNIDRARAQLGDEAIIGISCYNNVALALKSEQEGATYVAFGRFFSSSSKPLAAPATLNTLRTAKSKLTIPLVAIGGILPENGDILLTAGADLLAVIGGIFNHDIKQSIHAYHALFQ